MQSLIISSSRRKYVVPALLLGSVFFIGTAYSARAMTADQLVAMEGQLKTASVQLAQFQSGRLTGFVLGVSTTSTVAEVPIRPVCRVSLDKKSYILGESIKFSWKTTGGNKVELVNDTSGKDTLVVPQGEFKVGDGFVSIPASVLGNPIVTLKVTSRTGHSMTCSRVVPIVGSDATKKDVRLAPLYAQLVQLGNKLTTLVANQEAINQKINELKVKELELMIKIEQITNSGVGSTTLTNAVISRVSYGGEAMPDLSTEFAQASYTMTVQVTANDHDVYIPKIAADKNIQNTGGFLIGFKDKTGRDISSNIRSTSVSSSASADKSGRYIVKEGTSEAFTITAVFYADKKIDNNYTLSVKGLSFYMNPDIASALQKAALSGDMTGLTGYLYKGVFGFKG